MAVQDVVVATPAARQGTFTSTGVLIPPVIVGLSFILNLQLADKLAIGLSASLHVERSIDGATNWLPVGGFIWTSYGPGGYKTNPDPNFSFEPSVFPNQFFRVILDIPQTLTVGATVEITT